MARTWRVPKLEYWQAPCVADAALPGSVIEALERARAAAGGRADVLPLVQAGGAVVIDAGVWVDWFGPIEADLTARRMALALLELLERKDGKNETG